MFQVNISTVKYPYDTLLLAELVVVHTYIFSYSVKNTSLLMSQSIGYL